MPLVCSGDEDECMEEVQHVLKRIMMQKKAACRRKVAKIEQVCPAALYRSRGKDMPVRMLRTC